ncbi:hypothetical protein ACS0TY_036875 [Phlomoides rotata]
MSPRKNISTSSGGDEKKMKRMISNCEAARRSRMKNEQRIKDFNDKITYFTIKNGEMVKKIEQAEQRLVAVNSENRALRMEGEEEKKRLEMLEKIVEILSGN